MSASPTSPCQESFAEKLNVSRQAVQKWESGVALPDLSNLTTMAKKFGVSLDTLLLDSNARTIEELSFEKEFSPEYASMHGWELYSEQLDVEYVQ